MSTVRMVVFFIHLLLQEGNKILRISPYSARMRENTNQKNSEYGQFSSRVLQEKVLLNVLINLFHATGLFQKKFQNFRILNFMTSWNVDALNEKHVLLNDLGRKHSLVMKSGQFMSLYNKCDLETSSCPFLLIKNQALTFTGKWNFRNKLILLDMQWQNYRNMTSNSCRLPQILF